MRVLAKQASHFKATYGFQNGETKDGKELWVIGFETAIECNLFCAFLNGTNDQPLASIFLQEEIESCEMEGTHDFQSINKFKVTKKFKGYDAFKQHTRQGILGIIENMVLTDWQYSEEYTNELVRNKPKTYRVWKFS